MGQANMLVYYTCHNCGKFATKSCIYHVICMFSSPCLVIVEEEEMSTSIVEREPQQVDPATGMLEIHCNKSAEHDD